MNRIPLRARNKMDKERKRRLLIDSAKSLFVERGYGNTTVDMITERAGVSTGTFYIYFKSKSEVYKVFQDEGIDILTGMIKKAVANPSMSPISKVTAAVKAYFRFYRECREYFDLIAVISLGGQDELRERESEIGRRIDDKTLILLREIEGVIKEGVDSGDFYPVDTWEVTNVLWGMLDGLIILSERDNVRVIELDIEELIKTALETAFYGFARRGKD
ncbi:MAG: TetR/AcrR family transcriptional regulator [Deltaproteobacteria bacterium]|uniref:TetR/AcrR family transcriptional regulator n=1 Tax=Candidatus Zymogenus saltonus TaxID=2844893 RepID=A0A9D8KDU1_9DELT|nr:TetR/AcrR family transcriptional regulator [Candidatus Zymogenus saltonus]